jgi:uncharacterized phage protein (TIGR02220 family)
MYGKIFASMYDGTLRADWKALITFQQFIVLSDPHGTVDMTVHAIHGRTGIPLDIIEHGIQVLQSPDPHSRSGELEGRRIVPVDDTRPWGWKIVNYIYYRNLASAEEKRIKDRERIAEKRKTTSKSGMSQDVAAGSNLSLAVEVGSNPSVKVVNVAQVEGEEEAEGEVKTNTLSGRSPTVREQAKLILRELNRRTLKNPTRGFQETPTNLRFIEQRLKETDFNTVLDVTVRKIMHWWNTDQDQYLRPETLYNATKFSSYVGELGTTLRRKDGKTPKQVFTAEHLAILNEPVNP